MKFSKVGRKNFVIFSLVTMLGLIGYVNYNLNRQSFLQTSSELEEYKMTMLEESGVVEDLLEEEDIVMTEEIIKEDNPMGPGEDMTEAKFDDTFIVDSKDYNEVTDLLQETNAQIAENLTNKEAMKSSIYFIESRLERDKKRSELISHLNDIINNQLTSDEIRNEALNLKMDMVSSTEKEVLIENMIIAKGFNDAIVYLSDGSINVIVNSETLVEEDVAKIVDIIKRETDASMDDITIMSKQ